MADREKSKHYTINGRPIRCTLCQGTLSYIGGGQYECVNCKHVELDDFGKVKNFLEECGVAPASVISEATGVREDVIEELLKDGRIQIVKGSKMYLKCEKCGKPIRYGRYCQRCVIDMTGRISSAFDADDEDNLSQIQFNGRRRFKKLDD